MPPRRAFLWASYDFAASLLFANVGFYFVPFLVTDRGVSDLYVVASLLVATLLLIALSPILGVMVDCSWRKVTVIRLLTAGAVASAFGLGLFQSVWLLLVAYLIYTFCYQISLVPYNALLADIAPPEARGRISGLGESANWFGGLAGLVITLPIVSQHQSIFGAGRQAAFVPAALLFAAFAAAFLFRQPERPPQPGPKPDLSLVVTYRQILADLKDVKRYPGTVRFLVTNFFFNDSAATFLLFATLYLTVTGHFSDQTKIFLSVLALVGGGVGALVGGAISDKIGTARAFSATLLAWFATLGLLVAATQLWQFAGLIALAGGLMGSAWAIARKFLSLLVPRHEQGKFFGVYALSTRLGAILGPPLWSLAALLFLFAGNDRYRASLGVLAILALVSFFIARGLPNSKSLPEAGQTFTAQLP